MFARWRENRKLEELSHTIYCLAVEQARAPAFYERLEVEDSLEGRLDMILLHIFIIMYSLKGEGEKTDALLQRIQEVMIRDIDRSLREIGVGDMNVGKQMRHVGASLLGRLNTYTRALEPEAEPDLLEEAIVRNIYRDQANKNARSIARYLEAALSADRTEDNRSIYWDGEFRFPSIEAFTEEQGVAG